MDQTNKWNKLKDVLFPDSVTAQKILNRNDQYGSMFYIESN